MPISLRLLKTSTFRLSAIYLFIFAVSVAAILGYVYWSTTVLLEQQTDEAIVSEVRSFADQYRQRGVAGVLDTVNRRSALDNGSLYLMTNNVGRRLGGNLRSMPLAAVRETGWIEFPYAVDTGSGIEKRTAKAFNIKLTNGSTVIIGRDVEERRRFTRIITETLYWALGIAVVLGIGGALMMSRNFLNRVEQIDESSRKIMAGNLSERMPVAGSGDELDRLADGLNAMLDQIERLMAGMREVSSNVAHDLRTPLTRLRARTEDALRSNNKAEYRAALERNMHDADQLLLTFNALLSIARAETGEAREGFIEVDAAALMSDLAELFEPAVEEARGSLIVLADQPVTVRADRQLLAQALTNLIDNAIKYGITEETGKPELTLTARAGADGAELIVADRGAGVPEADRERVLQRFTRLDDSRNRQGSGLGLALVAGVVKLHGGELLLEDNAPGLRVRMVLPTAS